MTSSALGAVVEHDGRLEVLRCILEGGPLGVSQLSARTGEPPKVVDHWLKLLDSFGLVEAVGDLGDGEPLYTVTLEDHPDWVREAVERHRRPI